MKEITFEIKLPVIKFSPQRKLQLKILLSLLAIVGVFFLKDDFDFTLIDSFILIYFFFSLIWLIPSQLTAGLALFFLIACPLLIYLEKTALAETSAIYAYYFLIIVVINEIAFMLFSKLFKKDKT